MAIAGLQASNITANSATVAGTATTNYSSTTVDTLVIKKDSSSGETVQTVNFSIPSGTQTGQTVSVNVTGLKSNTTYAAVLSGTGYTVSTTFQTTVDTTKRSATQTQWEDLADRVKAKSDVKITMTDTDPGEGAALAADSFIGVYGGDAQATTADIKNNAVTREKVDFTSLVALEPVLTSIVTDNGSFTYTPTGAEETGTTVQYFFISNHVYRPMAYIINCRYVGSTWTVFSYKIYGFANSGNPTTLTVTSSSNGSFTGTVDNQCRGMLYRLRVSTTWK